MGARRADGKRELIQRARALCVVALAAALLPAPPPVAAQTTDAYWQSLRSKDDVAAVLATTAPPHVHEDIAEGLRLFRAWELSGDEGSARRAGNLLRNARVPAQQRAWHALALAMVYARGPDSRMRLGDDAWFTDAQSLGSARSLRLLRGALEADPGFREAALELGTWALDRAHRVVAAEAAAALAALPEDADVLMTRAALELLLDQPGFAAHAAARAQLAGADASVARLTRAWALFQHERTVGDAVELYYLGATQLTPAGRAAYGRDLQAILTADEREEWNATPDARAAEWLRGFWARNAARAGVLPDERLAEHYRRLHRARIDHPLVSLLSVLQQQATFAIGEDSRRYGLSLRGFMLVRHGDPMRLSRIESCLSDPWPASGSSGTICSELGSNRLAVFQAAGRLARGDSYFPFTRALDLYHGVYAFRGPDRTNELVFAVGLPARSANALIEGPDRMAGILSAVMLSDSGDYIRSDSAFDRPVPRHADPLAGETDAVTLLLGTLRVPAGDATRSYRVTVSDAHRHAGGIGTGSLRTYAFADFSVSDIVVAPEGMPAGWQRGDELVPFAPLATYRPGDVVTLYYEIYGLAAGAAFVTEIELVPPAEGVADRVLDLLRDRAVRFRFDGFAGAPHEIHGLQQSRVITLTDMGPGRWTLRVRITDAAGAGTVRETTIDIERP